MEEKEIQNELASIRNLMERSSKFISLSGMSGILAGIYALIGASFAYFIVENSKELTYNSAGSFFGPILKFDYTVIQLFVIAVIVLFASIITGVLLSGRKAKKNGQKLWGQTSRSLLFHMATPLITGGVLILVLIARGYFEMAAPASLIFYGLSLVGASNFTFTMVKYLGLCEIILGLIAACLPAYGLLFWAFGFGVLHIVYGSLMYLKYDR